MAKLAAVHIVAATTLERSPKLLEQGPLLKNRLWRELSTYFSSQQLLLCINGLQRYRYAVPHGLAVLAGLWESFLRGCRLR